MKKIALRFSDAPASDKALKQGPTWLAMGFRPMFLLASSYACIAVGLWLLILNNALAPPAYLPATIWHAHEMIFGFGLAVVAGFLLTAARNWTGLDTLHGYKLLGLVLTWTLGRFVILAPVSPWLVAVVEVAFPLGLALTVGRVILKAGSRRNFGIVAVLFGLTGASAAVQAQALGLGEWARPALYGALHLVVVLNVIIGGRIIPLFTRNKLKIPTSSVPWIDGAAVAASVGVAVLATLDAAQVSIDGNLFALIAGGAAILQLARMSRWGTIEAFGEPMLAVLHTGYLWIALGYGLLAVAAIIPDVLMAVAMHGLTIGVVGTMTVGMMARVSMGHTGRTIKANGLMKVAFVAINLAALARLSAVVLPPESWMQSWMISGGLFILAFGALFIGVVQLLLSPRPDGRPG